jgi:hypothetical protein
VLISQSGNEADCIDTLESFKKKPPLKEKAPKRYLWSFSI